MKPTTLEWISKAEDDWHVAGMSYRARKHPSYDAAAFHAQQCAEKYLKARLEEAGIAFARTHDLRAASDGSRYRARMGRLATLSDLTQSFCCRISLSRHFGYQSRFQRCAEELS